MIEGAKTPDWEALDTLIFENRKLELLKALRENYGYDLAVALEVFSSRYAILRSERSDHFGQSDNEYWKGFYS